MPKIKKIAVPVKRRPRRRRKNPAQTSVAVSNPPLFADLAEFVVPGFGGYAATRLLSRIVYTQLSKKWPTGSRHLATGSSVASFLAAWFLLHRVKRLEKYHTPATVGAAIAALQTIIQTYLPKFGWIVSDFQPTVGSATTPILASSATARPTAAQIKAAEDELLDEDEDSDKVVDPLNPIGALGTLTGSTLGDLADDDEIDEYLKDLN